MDAMHHRHAGRGAAREDGVEMHRIAIAGNVGEPDLIGRREGSRLACLVCHRCVTPSGKRANDIILDGSAVS